MNDPADALKTVWDQIEAGRLDEAEQNCLERLRVGPELAETNFAMGVILFRKGNKAGALSHLQEFLRRSPENVSALGLTAQLLLEAGNPDEALDLARRAYQLRPGDGPMLFLHISGQRHLALGEPLSALKAFQELIRLDPRQAAGYLGAAEVYSALGSSFDAAEMVAKAAEASPTKSSLLSLAILELKLGRPDRTFTAATEVLHREPHEPHAAILAAQSLIEQDRAADAEPYWARAAQTMTNLSSLELKHGASLAMMGHFEEGEEHLRRSIALEPRQGSAYHMIFANRKATENDRPMLVEMESILGNEQVAPSERAALAFAIGKAADDLGDPEKAFNFYDAAHEIQKSLLPAPFSLVRMEQQFRAQQELFSPRGEEPEEDGRPAAIFVTGMMRSGTTLTEQILSAHSKVIGAGEVDFWTGSELLMIDRAKPLFLAEVGKERKQAYNRILDSFGGKSCRVVDKYPGNLNVLGMIHHLMPNAHIVCLRRKPVDVAISLWATHSNPFTPFTIERNSIVEALRQSSVQADYWRETLPPNRFLEVPYESLVSEPDHWIRRILDFCNLDFEEACLAAGEAKKKVRTPSLWQVRQPVYQTSVDRWRRYEPWLREFAELL